MNVFSPSTNGCSPVSPVTSDLSSSASAPIVIESLSGLTFPKSYSVFVLSNSSIGSPSIVILLK